MVTRIEQSELVIVTDFNLINVVCFVRWRIAVYFVNENSDVSFADEYEDDLEELSANALHSVSKSSMLVFR